MFGAQGLPCSLYTDRGSHYFYTAKAGEAVDKERLTQVGRALDRLGIEHIPAYSPEARGRSERMFGTLQDRLVKELELAGITDIATANRLIREVYLPQHNARFAKPAALPEKAFVAVDPGAAAPRPCAARRKRIVGRDNTVAYGGLKLQLPESRMRAHYVKATREGSRLSGWHARPSSTGRAASPATTPTAIQIAAPTAPSLAPCSPPSRRGLETPAPAAAAARRPALTAARHEAQPTPRVGTKKRASRSNKETDPADGTSGTLRTPQTAPGVVPLSPDRRNQKRTTDVLPKPDNLISYRQAGLHPSLRFQAFAPISPLAPARHPWRLGREAGSAAPGAAFGFLAIF